MGNVNLKQASKQEWYNTDRQGEGVTNDQLQLGAILRMADAAELMASNYTNLQKERDLYLKWYKEKREETVRLARRISALQGVITKMKKKL